MEADIILCKHIIHNPDILSLALLEDDKRTKVMKEAATMSEPTD